LPLYKEVEMESNNGSRKFQYERKLQRSGNFMIWLDIIPLISFLRKTYNPTDLAGPVHKWRESG
jgi:hypothetical protein